ncbi:MAG: glycosyltransferase [Clostridia bacterium]|nr:glycosyltransferase [Clostridia bacterium]MBP3707153.1 glycosyltransferase [Clostridia bacterium]
MNTPKQSIIMPYHRNKEMLVYTTTLLESILPKDVEVIIVGNNNNSEELNVKLSDRFTYIKYDKSMLYSKTVNLGVELASGDIITLCDQDIYGYDDWYSPLIEKLLSSPKIGSVSSKLLNPINDRIIDFGIEYSKYRIVHPLRGLKKDHPLAMMDRKVTSSTSATLTMWKDVYKQVNGMDLDMSYCCSDCDIGIKIGGLGLENWVLANSVAYHRGSSSFKNGKSSSFSHLRNDSTNMFWAKNHGIIRPTVNEMITSFVRHLCQYKKLDPMYYFVNLSSLSEYEWYASCLKEAAGLEYCEIFSYPQNLPHYSNPIQIYDELPYTFMNVNLPIVYFVDYIPALQNNIIWQHMRNIERDLVLDCHGSLVYLSEIISGMC